MLKIFYKDKVIVFDSKNNNYNNNQLLFYKGDPEILKISILEKKLDYIDELYIICDDINLSFSIFAEQFTKIDAAGGVVCCENGDILMIYRDSKWDLPKGKREIGEDIKVCAEREVIEECGITTVEVGDLIIKTLHIFKLKGEWIIKSTYWYKMKGDKNQPLIPQKEEGITDVRWVGPQTIKELTENSYKTIIEVINKYQTT